MTRTGRKAGPLSMLLVGAAVSGLACVGSVEGMDGPGKSPTTPPTNKPPTTPPSTMPPDDPTTPVMPGQVKDSAGPAPLRRLTRTELNNTLRDLLGLDQPAIGKDTGIAADVEAFPGGFMNGATVGNANDARQFLSLTGDITKLIAPRLGSLLPQGCATPAAGAEEGCAKKFIEEFGLRAFRRPLESDEQGDLLALYTKLRGADVGQTFPEAITSLVSAMIQSPMFGYRWELGGEPTRDGPLVRLNHYEIASRLSYLALASMPDAELFAAAKAGELNDPDKIAEQARRLLKSEKAKAGLAEFVQQWLKVSALPTLSKDESYTNYTPAVGETMLRETGTFFASIMQGSGKLTDLYSSSSSYVDGALAKLYGQSNVTGNELRQVNLNPAQRAGILTHGSFLAAHSDGDEPHPVFRGLEVMEKVLCTPVTPPVDFVPPAVKDATPGVSNRQRFEEATSQDASCNACHAKINGIGFAFENYDAVGGWRDMDAGKPVNATGSYPFQKGMVSFQNAVEFSKAVATSQEARDCMTKQFIEYVLRRHVLDIEGGSKKAMAEAFEKSDFDLRELFVATVKTRAFTHRQPLAGEGQQ